MPLFRIVSGSTLCLPPLPALGAVGLRTVAFADIAASLRRHSPACLVSVPKDSHFISVPTGLLQPALAWTFARLDALGLRYAPEVFDCDDFAAELERTLVYIFARAGQPGAPATGTLTVRQQASFGGVAGVPIGTHALNCVQTDTGLWVLEPQARQLTAAPIEHYPNRTGIIAADGF